MKVKLFVIVVSAVLLNTIAAMAQPNILKLNVAALGFTNISLQDEYILNENSSVALGVSYLPSRSVPTFLSDKDSTGNISRIGFKGFSITPEYRYYFSGNAPKGFYVAGYFRYAKYSLDNFIYTYTDDNGIDKYYNLSGDWTVAGVGIMLGSQWKLGDQFVFDWWIVGGAFGKNGGKISGTGTLTASDQADFQKSVNDIDIPVGTLKSTITSNSASVEYDTGLPAIRGFGLCFGYIFDSSGGSHRH